MITDRDAVEMRIVLEAIRDLAAGRKRLDDLTLSTSESLALCLACELPLPAFANGEKLAWERLNEVQRRLVATINPKFQAREWTEIPVYFA